MMRTARQVLTIDVLVDIADGLAMPDRARLLLGLAPIALLVATVGGDEPVGWTSGPAAAGGRPGEEDWLERRDFLAVVAATAFGPGGGALLPGSASGLPDVSSGPPSRVGLHDVRRIETTTRAFRDWDHLHGGGLSRATVVAQFRHVLGMHEASATPAVRVALHHATAELGSLAAWMTYDVEEHQTARQLWMLALHAAREADDADLLAEVLTRMATRPLAVRARTARPSTEAFGRLLRRLHALPAPPVSLPPMRPMARLDAAVEADGTLGDADRAWLLERRRTLLSAFQLDSPLGHGLIHGDAHLGNLLPSTEPAGMVLADWDSVVDGPREWDLVLIAGNDRFGMSAADRAAFAHGYGYDVTTWPGWTVLRDLRELHSLAAYLRLAPTDPPAAAELRHRLASLRSGDRNVAWHALG